MFIYKWISVAHSIQYMCTAKAKCIGSFLTLHRYLHTLFHLDWSKNLQIRVRKKCQVNKLLLKNPAITVIHKPKPERLPRFAFSIFLSKLWNTKPVCTIFILEKCLQHFRIAVCRSSLNYYRVVWNPFPWESSHVQIDFSGTPIALSTMKSYLFLI